MKLYQITSSAGVDIGLYEGATPREAYVTLCRIVGHKTVEEAEEVSGGTIDDLTFTEAEVGEIGGEDVAIVSVSRDENKAIVYLGDLKSEAWGTWEEVADHMTDELREELHDMAPCSPMAYLAAYETREPGFVRDRLLQRQGRSRTDKVGAVDSVLPFMYGVTLTPAAARNVGETGIDPQADLAALRAGTHTRESLLAHCLDGADDDRAEGWREYVDAIAIAAEA